MPLGIFGFMALWSPFFLMTLVFMSGTLFFNYYKVEWTALRKQEAELAKKQRFSLFRWFSYMRSKVRLLRCWVEYCFLHI